MFGGGGCAGELKLFTNTRVSADMETMMVYGKVEMQINELWREAKVPSVFCIMLSLNISLA